MFSFIKLTFYQEKGIHWTNNCPNNCLVTSLVNAAKAVEERGPDLLRVNVSEGRKLRVSLGICGERAHTEGTASVKILRPERSECICRTERRPVWSRCRGPTLGDKAEEVEPIRGLWKAPRRIERLLAVQGTLKSLLQHHNSKASILQCSALFTVQLSLEKQIGRAHV